jgi:hypothetical protein
MSTLNRAAKGSQSGWFRLGVNLLHPTIEPIPEFHGKKSKKQTNLHLPTQSVKTVHRALGWANSD